jgi:hypothetical protein
MSWENRYPLPWAGLDLAKIETAARHIAALWSERPCQVTVHHAGWVAIYFVVTPAEERRWDLLGDVEDRFRLYDITDSETGWVEIGFHHLDAETWFEMASNCSGNSLYSGCAIEIAERFGRYFGVKCEPN